METDSSDFFNIDAGFLIGPKTSGNQVVETSTPVTFESGQTATVSGNVEANQGAVTADRFEGESGEQFEAVEGFRYTDDGFTAESASTFNYNSLTAGGVQGIIATPDDIIINHADTLDFNGMNLGNGNVIVASPEGIGIGNAESIDGRGLEASDVSVSHLEFGDDGFDVISIISNEDDNTIIYKDMAITLDANDIVNIKRNGNRWDLMITNGILRDDFLQVNCFEFSGRYEYKGANYDHFALDADDYKLCTRISIDPASEPDREQWGLIDLFDKKVDLRGKYNYQKLSLDTINPQFETIIESLAVENEVAGEADNRLRQFTSFTIDADSSRTYSHWFMIEEKTNKTCLYGMNHQRQHTILEYQNTALPLIMIDEGYLQVRHNDSAITLFSPGSDALAEFIAGLKSHYLS